MKRPAITRNMRRAALTLCLAGMIGTGGLSALSLTASAYENVLKTDRDYRYLSEAFDQHTAPVPIVHLDPLVQPTGRELLEIDRAEIHKDMTAAWRNLAIASRSGETAFLKDHFVATALEQAKRKVKSHHPGFEEAMVVLDHKASPRFLHADGSVFEMTSDDMLVVRYGIDVENDQIEYLSITRDCARQILFLKTAGWKVRNHELDCSVPVGDTEKERATRPFNLPMKGMNYYPAKSPWHEFWPQFDPQEIGADLDLMRQLGIDTTRIFIPFGVFTDPQEKHEMLEHLATFLRLAKARGIAVMPTLFDFRGTYLPSGWGEDYQYIKDVVSVLKRHDNVQIIDLKNEPDVDYQLYGEAQVDAWLITFSKLLQEIAPEISVTIGWLNADNAARMENVVDVVSYHEYGDPQEAASTYEKVKIASQHKTVLVTETGEPSWSITAGFPFSPASQAEWLERHLEALKATDGVFVWTLYDFDYEDTAKVATIPWRRAMQASYGLYDTKGAAKPAAELFEQFKFAGAPSLAPINDRTKQ